MGSSSGWGSSESSSCTPARMPSGESTGVAARGGATQQPSSPREPSERGPQDSLFASGKISSIDARVNRRGVFMAHTIRHLTGTAKPGPPNDRPAASAGAASAAVAHVAVARRHLDHGAVVPGSAYDEYDDQELHVYEVLVRSHGWRRSHRFGQSGRRRHRYHQGRRRLHEPDPDGYRRHSARPDPQGPRRRRDWRRSGLGPLDRFALVPPSVALRCVLHLDRTEECQAVVSGDHGLRWFQGQGVRRGKAYDPVCRYRRV